jgi:hypothetical protein
MAQARALAAKPLSGAKFDDFLDRLLTPHIRTNTPEDFIVENTRTYKKIQELMAGAAVGSDLPGVSGTWWGAVNAVTEYVDHHKPARDTDSRLNGAWFSHGATLKNNALALALAA